MGIIYFALTLGSIITIEVLHQKERSKLLDRIQAKDLIEYKKFEEPVKPKEEEKKEPINFV